MPSQLAPMRDELNQMLAEMRNFADVADQCELTEGNAQTAIRAWAYKLERLLQTDLRALSARSVSVPDGWVMVPIEPRLGMLEALSYALFGDARLTFGDRREQFRRGYAAMLTAAPPPPAAQPVAHGDSEREDAERAKTTALNFARRVVSHLDDASCDTSKMPEGMRADLRALRKTLDEKNLGYNCATDRTLLNQCPRCGEDAIDAWLECSQCGYEAMPRDCR